MNKDLSIQLKELGGEGKKQGRKKWNKSYKSVKNKDITRKLTFKGLIRQISTRMINKKREKL